MALTNGTRVRVNSTGVSRETHGKTGLVVEASYTPVVAFDGERFGLSVAIGDTHSGLEYLRPAGHTGSLWYVSSDSLDEITSEIEVGTLVKVTTNNASGSGFMAGDVCRVRRITEPWGEKHAYLEIVTQVGLPGRYVPAAGIEYVTPRYLEIVSSASDTMTHDEVRDLVRKWQTKHEACAVVDQALRDMGIDPNPVPQIVDKATVVRVARDLGMRNGMLTQVEQGLREAGLDAGPKAGEFGDGDTVQEVGYNDYKYKVYVVESETFIRRIQADDTLRDTMYKVTDDQRTQYVKIV